MAARPDAAARSAQLEYLPEPDHVRWLSLGHTPAAADIFWIRGVLYFAQGFESKGIEPFRWLASYVDVVINLDPDFRDIYRWGGTVMVLRSQDPSLEQVRLANHILEQGAERFPKDYKLPMAAGANCKFYVKTRDPEVRRELDACAARYFRMAAKRPGAPYHIATLAAQLHDSPEACEVLMAMYLKEYRDDTTRANIQGRLKDSSCGSTLLEQAQSYQNEFKELRKRWPDYLPDDMLPHVAVEAQKGYWSQVEAASPPKE